jgi:Fe-S cluster biosynthesis and repair protein YggX
MTLKFTNLPSGIKDKFWEECSDDGWDDWSDEKFQKLSKEYGLFYTSYNELCFKSEAHRNWFLVRFS